MKQIFVFIVLVFLSFSALAQEEPAAYEGDVRGFIWGVSKEDVKQFEKVVLFEEVDNVLFFVDEWHDIKILIGYEFWNDKLIRASIDFQKENYPNAADAIAFYIAREFELNEKLGVEGKQETIWKNPYYENKPNQFPLAILNGHVDLVTKWQAPRSDVVMGMSAENFEYTHRIIYESRALMAARAAQKKEDFGPLLAPPSLQE